MADYFPLCKLKRSPEKGQDDGDENDENDNNDDNDNNNDDDDNFSVTKLRGVP